MEHDKEENVERAWHEGLHNSSVKVKPPEVGRGRRVETKPAKKMSEF